MVLAAAASSTHHWSVIPVAMVAVALIVAVVIASVQMRGWAGQGRFERGKSFA